MQPEKKFRAGLVSASVWKNVSEKGNYSTVSISRAYLDKEKAWKDTNSFKSNDLPKAILVLQSAYEFIQFKLGEPAELKVA